MDITYMTMGLGILFTVLLLMWGVVIYHRLQTLAKLREQSWGNVVELLSQRHALTPELIRTVRVASAVRQMAGCTEQEQIELEEALLYCAELEEDATPTVVAEAENAFSHALGLLLAAATKCPQLMSSASFHAKHEELEELESELQVARHCFNTAVEEWNALMHSFPTLLVARWCGLKPALFFDFIDANEMAQNIRS